MAAQGQQCRPDPGRLVGRIGGGGRGGDRAGRDRHRHRRLDPPARGLRRHLRDQADLRPLLALGRSSPSPARSTRRGRWRGRVRDCAILLEAMAGFDPEGFRPRSTCRCRSGKRICRAISRASASAFPRNIASTACRGDIDALWDQRHRMAEGRGRDAGRDQPAAHQICAPDLLHHRAGRGLVQPRPL